MSHLTKRVHQAVLRGLTTARGVSVKIWAIAPLGPGLIVHDDIPETGDDVDLTCWISNYPKEAERIKNLCPKCKVILDAAMEGIDLTKVL